MRNMSFSLTTKQFNDRTKTVTRRLGWWFLKPGDVVMGVEKSMGLKKGEAIKKLHAFEVVSTKREILYEMCGYDEKETAREGFPELNNGQFIDMFAKHSGCSQVDDVNRIEFKHLPIPTNSNQGASRGDA
jgi:hypothetical protein